MKQEVKKDPKVALCRKCHGTGKIVSGRFIRKTETCPQCEGSGRVTGDMAEVHISCVWYQREDFL